MQPSDGPSPQISVYSFLTLRLHRAPAVRLIDTSTSRASTPSTSTASRPSSSPPPPHASTSTALPPPPLTHGPRTARTHDPDGLLHSLSLSSIAPTIPLRTRNATASQGPIFGHPSLKPATFLPPPPPPSSSTAPTPTAHLPPSQSRDAEMRSRDDDDDDDDAMDWTPTASPVRPGLGPGSVPVPVPRGGTLQNQTEVGATTGLETLLERTNIDTLEPGSAFARTGRRGGGVTGGTGTWSWGWVYTLSLVPLVGVMYYQLFR
jgi:hypothetical protein